MDDDYRALTAEEFDQLERNQTAADWLMVARMKNTIKLLMQVERSARLLCNYMPGVYENIERSLNNLDAGRQK